MLFKFAREAGEKFREGVTNMAEGIKDRIQGHKTDVKDLKVEESGDGRIVLKGKAKNRAEAEKAKADAAQAASSLYLRLSRCFMIFPSLKVYLRLTPVVNKWHLFRHSSTLPRCRCEKAVNFS